jgi:hypothetical protein
MKIIAFKNEGQDYKKTIIAFLTIPFDPALGATFDEVMMTAPLLQRVTEAEDCIELNEDEHKMICDRFINGRYQEISLSLREMLIDITGPGID